MASRAGGNTKNLQVKPTKATAAFSLSTILCLLPGLTKQDLKALQAAVDAELSKNTTIDTDLFYMLFDVANEKPMSVSKFSNSENGAIWRKNQPIFDAFINRLWTSPREGRADATPVMDHNHPSPPPSRIMMTAIKKFLLQLIVEDIKEQHIPLTLRIMCQQLAHIEAIFNRAYPGYLQNGLQRLILAQLGSK